MPTRPAIAAATSRPSAFDEQMKATSRASKIATAATQPGHISVEGTGAGNEGFGVRTLNSFEITPEGNGVTLEDEMMKVAGNQMDYQVDHRALHALDQAHQDRPRQAGLINERLPLLPEDRGTGLHAQSARMRVIAENLANADSAGKTPGRGPVPAQDPDLQGGDGSRARRHQGRDRPRRLRPVRFRPRRYEPGHPAADATGYVRYPNVNSLIETMDMREAQRSYEANLNVVTVTRQMLGATLDILRG